MNNDTDNNVTTDTMKLYLMYAAGDQLADIGTEFHVSPATISKRLKKFPCKLDEAKKQRAEFHNAKHRRAGSLSIDLQVKYLEDMPDDHVSLSKEMSTIIKIGETSERRADLNEGKPTERTAIVETLSLEDIEERIAEAKDAGNGLDS